MIFLEYYDKLKINRVSLNTLKLHLFPFSLKDKARVWLFFLPQESITIWDQLSHKFLSIFLPSSKTTQLRHKITLLFEAWERFNKYLRSCPHHDLEKWLLVYIFYNGLTYGERNSVAAAGGCLTNKQVDETIDLIEEMANNLY